MTADPARFREASEAAHTWLGMATVAGMLARLGETDALYSLFLPSAEGCRTVAEGYAEHAGTLQSLCDELAAAVPDGRVVWDGLGVRRYFSSAHEAAAGIALDLLETLAGAVEGVTDPAEQWRLGSLAVGRLALLPVLAPGGRDELRERLRRERAALLGRMPAADRPHAAVVVSQGGRSYLAGGLGPFVVTQAEDDVLQAFLRGGGWAMDKAQLALAANSDDAAATLLALRTRYGGAFADAVRCPERKGAGGYFVRVEQERRERIPPSSPHPASNGGSPGG